jgi:hypothetical protein
MVGHMGDMQRPQRHIASVLPFLLLSEALLSKFAVLCNLSYLRTSATVLSTDVF